jgi:hypothetical protein
MTSAASKPLIGSRWEYGQITNDHVLADGIEPSIFAASHDAHTNVLHEVSVCNPAESNGRPAPSRIAYHGIPGLRTDEGIRTLNLRILSPAPLPLGYIGKHNKLSADLILIASAYTPFRVISRVSPTTLTAYSLRTQDGT